MVYPQDRCLIINEINFYKIIFVSCD